jgi:hypothetical protein
MLKFITSSRHFVSTLLAAVLRPLYYMPCIRIGKKAISGRAVLNKKLWNKGALVHVWKKYFIVYEDWSA